MSMNLNRKFLPTYIEEINNNVELLNDPQVRANNALKIVIDYAFNPEQKFDLPKGTPPFKKENAPPGLTPGNILMELRRFYIFTKKKDLKPLRREALFIDLLEGVSAQEAELLIHIKDQTLPKLYKNLTANTLVEYGYLPEEYKTEPKKRGRPSKKKSVKKSADVETSKTGT